MHIRYFNLPLPKLRGFLSYPKKGIACTSNLCAQYFIIKSVLIYFAFGLYDSIWRI